MATNQISIEGGCILVGPNLWEYRYNDNDGFHTIVFPSSLQPKIGDDLVNGVLVVRTTPKINADYSKWIPPEQDVWPTNKMFE